MLRNASKPAKVLVDFERVYARQQRGVYAVGFAFRSSSRMGAHDADAQPWSVEGPRWLVSADSRRDAVRHMADLDDVNDETARALFTDEQQRVLYVVAADDVISFAGMLRRNAGHVPLIAENVFGRDVRYLVD
jgi:hypothetical protein